MKKPTVFISYSHADSQFVDQLADKLKASGVDVWIDKWTIKVGDSITEKINEGIGASDFLIVVLSSASANSKWVREELNAATIRNVEQEKHAFILPVLIEECEIPNLLQHRKYASFKDDPERAFRELLEVIQPTTGGLSGDVEAVIDEAVVRALIHAEGINVRTLLLTGLLGASIRYLADTYPHLIIESGFHADLLEGEWAEEVMAVLNAIIQEMQEVGE